MCMMFMINFSKIFVSYHFRRWTLISPLNPTNLHQELMQKVQISIIHQHYVKSLLILMEQFLAILGRIIKEPHSNDIFLTLMQVLSHLDIINQVAHYYQVISFEQVSFLFVMIGLEVVIHYQVFVASVNYGFFKTLDMALLRTNFRMVGYDVNYLVLFNVFAADLVYQDVYTIVYYISKGCANDD